MFNPADPMCSLVSNAMVVLSPSLMNLFAVAREVREMKENASVQRVLFVATWRRLLQCLARAVVPHPRGLCLRVRLPRCPWRVKAAMEADIARKVLPPAQLRAIAGAALESLGPDLQGTIKGTAAIYLGSPEATRRALAAPGDVDIAIRGLAKPADVLSAAMRVKARVAPLLSSRAVLFILHASGCSPDFQRQRVADQRVVWADDATLPLLCWLHPRPIYGHRGEEVWLARVGLSIRYRSAPLLLPLLDLAAETKLPWDTDRREEDVTFVGGLRTYSLLSCAHANLRMLFDETGARPWEAKKAQKRIRTTVFLAVSLWRGSPQVLLVVGGWLEATLQVETYAAIDPRTKLQYLLREPSPTVPHPEVCDQEGWRDSALCSLVVAIRCMVRRFHKTLAAATQVAIDAHLGVLQLAVCSWREAVAPATPWEDTRKLDIQ